MEGVGGCLEMEKKERRMRSSHPLPPNAHYRIWYGKGCCLQHNRPSKENKLKNNKSRGEEEGDLVAGVAGADGRRRPPTSKGAPKRTRARTRAGHMPAQPKANEGSLKNLSPALAESSFVSPSNSRLCPPPATTETKAAALCKKKTPGRCRCKK